MKIVLYKNVPDLGEEDSLVEVSDGYARNYLFPRRLGGPATAAAVAALDKRKAEKEKKLAARRTEFEELAQKLSQLEISIPADAGEGGKLFGSITSQDIAVAVHEIAKLELDKKKIELNEPIKVLGEYVVPAKIFQDISANLKIKIIAK
jgi:large subunit ribosomal protein L9